MIDKKTSKSAIENIKFPFFGYSYLLPFYQIILRLCSLLVKNQKISNFGMETSQPVLYFIHVQNECTELDEIVSKGAFELSVFPNAFNKKFSN